MDKATKIFLGCFAGILIINVVFLDFIWFKDGNRQSGNLSESVSSNKISPIITQTPVIRITGTSCGVDCQNAIIEEINRRLPTESPQTTFTSITPTQFPVQQGPKTFYISLVSDANSIATDWTDVSSSDFYFDLADYPGAKNVKWEINLRSVNESNPVYTRLYDVTNKRAVDFSELTTQTASFTLLRSADLRIWQGNNLYRVQLKSSNGVEVILGNAKLKIGY